MVHVPTDPPVIEAAATTSRRLDPLRWPPGLGRPSIVLPVVAAVLAVAIGAAVVRGADDSGPGPGEALVEVDGTVVVHRAGGAVDTVTDRTRLEPGDRLRVRSGSAELELADDVRFSAVEATGGRPATDVQMAAVPLLRSGPLLVVAPGGITVRSGAGEVRVGAEGAARLTRTAAVSVDVFRGRAVLASAGASRSVPALRNGDIVAAGELSRSRPVGYRSSDAWDRRFLSPALSLDRELASLVPGMRADGLDGAALAERLRSEGHAAVSATALRSLISQRSGALDAAVGTAVVGEGEGSSYRRRWDRAFGFHDAGAGWGLVAIDLGADPDAVIDVLSRALRGSGSTPGAGVDGEVASGAIDPSTGLPTGTGAAGGTAGGTAGGGIAGTGGGDSPTTASPATPITVPGVTVPGVAVPGVTVPVTLPGVTLPPITAPNVPVVTTLTSVLGGIIDGGSTGGGSTGTTGGVVCSSGGLGSLTGSGGLLGGVTGSGGLLPLCP
ncbi:hypothetical protein BH10ACT1_BH10ACT1_35090 [soil metagenome]